MTDLSVKTAKSDQSVHARTESQRCTLSAQQVVYCARRFYGPNAMKVGQVISASFALMVIRVKTVT